MKNLNSPLRVVFLLSALVLASASTQLRAAQWAGGGADLNWSTLANWTNNAPPSAAAADVFFIGGDYPISTNVQGDLNNILNNNYTVGTLSYLALSPGSNHTTFIPAGRILSLVGTRAVTIGTYTSTDALFVGTGADDGAAAQVYTTITGPGTLSISNPAANVDITQTSGSGGNKMATLDLSGLSLFTANLSQVRVGNGNSSGSAGQTTYIGNRSGGTLLLAKTNVIICNSTSWGLSVGDSPQNNGPVSYLRLGQTNTFFSDFGIGVGRRKGATLPASTTLNFQDGLPSPSAFFRNKAGNGPMGTWVIGDNGEVTSGIGSHTSGTMDFTFGSVDAMVGTIYVGRTYNGASSTASQNAQSLGTLTFEAGTIAASTLEVGYQFQNSPAIAVGTVNVSGSGVLVVSNDVRLARLVAATNGNATGTVNLSGKMLVGGRIYDGGGTSELRISGGLLDMQPLGDLVPGTITVDMLTVDGVITNAATISAPNITVGASGVIAGNTTIDLGTAGTLDATMQFSGFKLGSTQTLQGSGSVTGDLIQSAGATLSPGGSGVPGVFNLNNLTLNDAGNLRYDLSNDPSQIGGPNDYLVLSGNLTLAGTNNVTITPLSGDLGNGAYRLMDYSGSLTGDGSYFKVSGPLGQSRRTLTFSTTTANQVNLVVGGTAPASPLVWAGDGSANKWDLKTSANWKNGATTDLFYYLDSVLFDDTGSATPAVNLVGTLIPAAITVNSGTKNYTFSGSGSLSGAGGLTKSGAGTLTVANPGSNDFAGPIVVAGGTLQIGGSADRLPTLTSVTVSNAAGATLDLNNLGQTIRTLSGGGAVGGEVKLGTGVLTIGNGGVFDGLVSGGGKLVMNGTGTLQLSGANTYTGGTLINTGTVAVVNATGSGVGSGAVLIAGGTLQIGTNGTTGSIAPQPGGSITNNGALTYNRSDTLTPVEVITGAGSVRQAGRGTLIFNHDNSYTNTTTVNNNNGVLRVTSPSALGTLDGGTIVNGGNTPPPGAGGQLEMAGGIVFAPERLTLGCRGTNVFVWNSPSGFVNQSGTNTWTGPIDITQGGSYIALQSDSGLMRIQGSISGGPIATGTRMLVLRGVADGEVSGVISNGPVTTALSLCKGDSGTWTLSGNNLYTGGTSVSNGTLLVNGTIGGTAVNVGGGTLGGAGLITAPVTIAAGATLAPGLSVGILTISNSLTLAGTTVMEVSHVGATVANDKVTGLTSLTSGGTLKIVVLGTLVGGEAFRLFESAAYAGDFATYDLPVLSNPLFWDTNSVPVDGTLRAGGKLAAPPQFGSVSVSGQDLVIGGTGGPANGTYYVLTSTNVEQPVANWTPILTNSFDSSGNFRFTNAISPAFPRLFYLLRLP